jgi:hypothetical protein
VYLSSLDSVSFSFYPSLRLRSPAWWRQPTTPAGIADVAAAFHERLQDLHRKLRSVAGPAPSFHLGEFGLGCTDPQRPWDVEPESFLDGSGRMDPGARELRRKYYLGFFQCLWDEPAGTAPDSVTFWTVTHFDFAGALHPDSEFRDDAIIENLREHT